MKYIIERAVQVIVMVLREMIIAVLRIYPSYDYGTTDSTTDPLIMEKEICSYIFSDPACRMPAGIEKNQSLIWEQMNHIH